MRFTKMHGAGNDYIYVNCMDGTFGGDESAILNDERRLAEIARRISRPHFGIGADGMVLIMPSEVADVRMRMFNADGSEGKMCGNATRCIGKYVYDNGYIHREAITLETASGIKYLTLYPEADDKVEMVTVDMGAPELIAEKIPVILPEAGKDTDVPVSVEGEEMLINPVSMGNPHGVVFVDAVTDALVLGIGPKLEVHGMWPDRANIEFAHVVSDDTIEMRVWERGSGETLACGTGACATAVAAMRTGRVGADEVTIRLIGGDLKVRWDRQQGGHVYMTGSATTVFEGKINL